MTGTTDTKIRSTGNSGGEGGEADAWDAKTLKLRASTRVFQPPLHIVGRRHALQKYGSTPYARHCSGIKTMRPRGGNVMSPSAAANSLKYGTVINEFTVGYDRHLSSPPPTASVGPC